MNQKKNILSGYGSLLKAIRSTIFICTKQIFDGGFLFVAGGYMIQAVQFVMLIFIWKSLNQGEELLTYTLMATILHQELNIISPATSSLWEGSVIGRFLRPMPVEASFIAETIGKWWIPNFLFFGLPLWILAPFLGISPWPASLQHGILAFISLILAASLGFAIDLIFASFAMHLKNGCFAALAIREAIFALLSGEMIPFTLFPKAVGTIFSLMPLGSIGHGPLTIYTGLSDNPAFVLGLQVFWNLTIWTGAILFFRKSKERMISFGG